jgi:alpha-galactosidase
MILAVRNVVRSHFYIILFLFYGHIASSFCTRYLAAQSYLAQLPPMGWNSWDAYGTTVREDEVKANADVMAKELARFGWQYIVVDIQWYEPNARSHGYRENAKLDMDDYGRLMPAMNRFPSAANGAGFKTLADYIHSRGLKFGIHILRGMPRQAVARNTPIYGTTQHAREIADTQHLCHWNTDMYGVDMSKPGAQAYYDSIVSQYA